MIILGFVVFVAVVVIAAALIVQNPTSVTVQAFNQSLNLDMRWLVVAGLALTALGLLGLGMMRLGTARYIRLRGEHRELVAENKRLAKQAAAAEPAGPDTPPPPAPMTQTWEHGSAALSSDRPVSARDW